MSATIPCRPHYNSLVPSLTVSIIAALVWFASVPAFAHRRDFPVTYDWFQASPGERELEVSSLYHTSDNSVQHQLEFEYGVTNRFMVAPNLVYAHGAGEGLHLEAMKLETRYQLGTFAVNRVLPGLYLEYEKPSHETSEIEGKIILSRYDGRGGDLSFNGVVERTMTGGASSRFAYSFGYAVPVGHALRGGAEVYKNIDDGRVNGGPTVAFSPACNWWVVTAVGLPLTHTDGYGANLHLTTEFEF